MFGQAIPYCWTLLYIPMHFLTHELLLFATGVWTTNIHDCIHGRCALPDPILLPPWVPRVLLKMLLLTLRNALRVGMPLFPFSDRVGCIMGRLLVGRADPIMGAGYHTIHHTTYKHNYGHYFVYMDKLFGTLVTPEDYEIEQRSKREAQ
jgi:lathosterol oxidase